jgi:hypothetical protein
MQFLSLKYVVATAALLTGFTAMAQKQTSIRLNKGDNISVTTTTKISSSISMMGQEMEIMGDMVSGNQIKVEATKDNAYDLTSTLTKIKMSMDMMGQNMTYDSDNPDASSDERMAGSFKGKLNKPVPVTIGNDGKIISAPAPDAEEANMISSMMGGAMNISEGDIVASCFMLIPAGNNTAGATWTEDVSKGEDVKIVYTYVIKEIKDGHALLAVKSENNIKMKAQQMGMEVVSTMKGGSEGEVLVELSNGLIKKRTMVLNMTGTADMQGMSIPVKMTSTTTTDITK